MATPHAMSPTTHSEEGAARAGVGVRFVVLAMLVVVGVAALVAGRAPGTLSGLENDLRAGELREVTVQGRALDAGWTGCSTQTIVWRHLVVSRHVDVVVEHGASGCSMEHAPVLEPATLDAAQWVRQLDADVVVHRAAPARSTTTLGGWQVPTAVGLLAFVAGLVVLCLIVSGPPPWRGTRWAWFWLSGSVAGLVGFLVLSGPFPGLRAPRPNHRRLTGGWAFLIGLTLAAVAPTWLHLTG